MRSKSIPFIGRQPAGGADDVSERAVELSDVVKKGYTLSIVALSVVEIRRIRDDERVPRNASDMRTGYGTVCLDGIEECLECRGADSRHIAPDSTLSRIQCGSGCREDQR